MFFGGHDHALTGLPAAFFRPAVREGKPPVVASEKHGYERRVPVHDGLLARTVPRADHAHTVVFRVDRVMLRVNVNGISRDWLWFRSCRHFASVSLWNRSRETAQAYPSGATSDSAARNGVGCVGAASQWAAPPLRTTGCLKKPKLIALRAASPWAFEICAQTVSLSCVHQRISRSSGPGTAASRLSLRFVLKIRLPQWAAWNFQEGHLSVLGAASRHRVSTASIRRLRLGSRPKSQNNQCRGPC